MKLKLKQIVDSKKQIQDLLEIKLPVKISYRINKLVNKLDPELVIYENKRNELIKELGEKVEGTETVQVKTENIPKFIEEMNILNDIDVEVDFEKIKVEDLGDIQIAPKDLVDWLFE